MGSWGQGEVGRDAAGSDALRAVDARGDFEVEELLDKFFARQNAVGGRDKPWQSNQRFAGEGSRSLSVNFSENCFASWRTGPVLA
jgi:hypothetical protein